MLKIKYGFGKDRDKEKTGVTYRKRVNAFHVFMTLLSIMFVRKINAWLMTAAKVLVSLFFHIMDICN